MTVPERSEKPCANCTQTKSLDQFAIDRSRPDGRTYWCRECRNARARRTHVWSTRTRPKGTVLVPFRDGDVKQARRRVNYLVEADLIPAPNALPCVDCGHEWEEGERRHEYDHHRGYAAEHHETVEAVCTTCHHAREMQRAAA